jgi:hypothetical protein
MALTGHAEGPPLPAPGPLAASAVEALRALRALAPDAPLPTDAAALLGEHAACFGYTRRGRTSPGGSCRLLRCADGWIAVNLARAEDVAAVPAWLEGHEIERCSSATLLERARLLSLPVAVAGPPPKTAPPWVRVEELGEASAEPNRAPLVVDLSSLWAGPLCTSLLADVGARVLKLESTRRPDGARGNERFFDLMNGGKQSVALDFGDDAGRRTLRALVERADIVVEATRPRALAQLGIEAETWVCQRPGRTWLSITGYGRHDPAPGRVAFGDDAAVAAGLAWATGASEGAPLFCGDAIADPLTGLHAAVATFSSWKAGGGRLLDISLRDVAAHALLFPADDAPTSEPALAPRARPIRQRAAALGEHTGSVLRELDVPC